jgi:hypothetical protein
LEPNAAERAVPLIKDADTTTFNESWAFFVRAVLATGGDCEAVAHVLTLPEVPMGCQEDGCWLNANAPAKVTCTGDTARIEVGGKQSRRDCSRAGMRCDESSDTGCTDRALVRCETGGSDRCDGDIKLGCDTCGFVSFHDCSWDGGHCEETHDGANCVPPRDSDACAALLGGCDGNTFSICVEGQPVKVDCAANGNFICSPQSATCSKNPGTSGAGAQRDSGVQ